MPVGASGFKRGIGYSVTLAGSRIELAEDLLAEAGVPRDAARVDDHVVRLPRSLRQIVLGVDDLRRLARRPRQRLERVAPLRSGAQIDRRQILGLRRHAALPLLGRICGPPPTRGAGSFWIFSGNDSCG